MSASRSIDIAIVGGGLAGLTCALHVRQRFPDLRIAVFERQRHPVPAAAHKVGESTVEIGAHYFAEVLGLREHLQRDHLRKFGFRFFFSDRHPAIERTLELGVSDYLSTPTYQLDRGILENHLGERARSEGIQFHDGAIVRSVELNAADHRLEVTRNGKTESVSALWVIDASGRAGVLKRQLQLAADNAHDANAVWFRIGARIDVEEWTDDGNWLARCIPQSRWLSTSHLVGKGYWVWLIPLASGSHSVGIVADARTHPLNTMNSFERALQWLREHQPQLAGDIERKRHLLQDFHFLKNFSYGCKRVFSEERWALTGEAGVFLDPFYSPGSDFIAIANTYIVELIARDLAGESLREPVRIFEKFFFSFYESTLSLYVDQYDLFADPRVLPVKVIWDYAYYWGVLCLVFFQNKLADSRALRHIAGDLLATRELNAALQTLFRDWSRRSDKRNAAVMFDQKKLSWFADLNRRLDEPLDDAQFIERMQRNARELIELANEIVARAKSQHPELNVSAVQALVSAGGGSMRGGRLFAEPEIHDLELETP